MGDAVALAAESWQRGCFSALSLCCSVTLDRLHPPCAAPFPHLYNERLRQRVSRGPLASMRL